MYVGRDFDPADTHESELFGFDFTNDLTEGDAVSTVEWECRVASNSPIIDATPAARLKGSPIVVSPKVYHRIEGMLPGVVYRLQATATTDLSNKIMLHSYVRCGPDEGASA